MQMNGRICLKYAKALPIAVSSIADVVYHKGLKQGWEIYHELASCNRGSSSRC